MGTEARGDEEAAHLGLAEAELVVRCERLGPVDQPGHLDVVHRRHALLRVLGDLLEAVPLVLEEATVEIGRDRVEPGRAVGEEGGRRITLVAAHHQAAAVLAEVDEEVGVTEGRQALVRGVLAEGLRDQVLVRHRDERDPYAGEATDLGSEHPARVHDHLGLDPPVLGLDRAHPAVGDVDPGDAGVLEDLQVALAARDVHQCVGELGRVDVAVGGQPRGAEDAVGDHQRELLLRLRRRDQLQGQAEGLRPPGLAAKLLHPLLARGEPDAAALDPARIELRLLRETPVDVDGVHHHLRQRHRAAQLADEAGGVEGRARCELGAIDEDDVLKAELRQVVRDRRAAHPAPDDHAAGRVGELDLPRAHAAASSSQVSKVGSAAIRSSRAKWSRA